MRDWNARGGRPHLEAFPAIKINEAIRCAARGAMACEWSDQDGSVIGHARLVESSEDHARFIFEFFGTVNVEEGRGDIVLDLIRVSINPHRDRTLISCPGCRRHTDSVFWVEANWACRSCHGLVFIRQRLNPVNKKIVDRDKLARKLALRRPIRRSRLYRAEVERLAAMTFELERMGAAPLPEELRFRTWANWLPAHELHPSPRSGSWSRIWVPQSGIGLVGLTAHQQIDHVLVGSRLFYRSIEDVLYQKVEAERGRLHGSAFAAMSAEEKQAQLVRASTWKPLAVSGEWRSVEETRSDDDAYELRGALEWLGDPILLTARPTSPKIASASDLRAVLDDHYVTLVIRLPRIDRKAAEWFLEEARATLMAVVHELHGECERINESVPVLVAGHFV